MPCSYRYVQKVRVTVEADKLMNADAAKILQDALSKVGKFSVRYIPKPLSIEVEDLDTRAKVRILTNMLEGEDEDSPVIQKLVERLKEMMPRWKIRFVQQQMAKFAKQKNGSVSWTPGQLKIKF